MGTRRSFIRSIGTAAMGIVFLPAGAKTIADLVTTSGPDPEGFFIRLIPSGALNVLSFTPQANPTGPEAIATARVFFSNLLFDLPDVMKDCREHFKQFYKTLPANTNYYYAVEKQFDINGNAIKRYCFPVGSGESVVEAYSNYLLTPHIIPDNSYSYSETGHFVRAKFVGEEMIFEPLSDDYELSKKAAHILSREKLKSIATSASFDQSPLPSTLEYSNHWLAVTKQYEEKLRSQQAYEKISGLNEQFRDAEKEFFNNLKLYKEYKIRQAELARTTAMVGLIMQGISLATDIYASEKVSALKNEMQLLEESQMALKKEVLQANQNAMLSIQKAQQIRDKTINEFRRINTPVSDPKIDVNWIRELY